MLLFGSLWSRPQANALCVQFDRAAFKRVETVGMRRLGIGACVCVCKGEMYLIPAGAVKAWKAAREAVGAQVNILQ